MKNLKVKSRLNNIVLIVACVAVYHLWRCVPNRNSQRPNLPRFTPLGPRSRAEVRNFLAA